jgi:RNase P subunit RPR2
MSTIQQFKILGDCGLLLPLCSNCYEQLPPSAQVEVFETQGSIWVVVECKKCGRRSPFQLEKPR